MSEHIPTFKPLPSKESLLKAIELHQRHLHDLTSYAWYLIPLARRFGDKVYEVAAQSLTESGIETSAAQLQALAEEMQTPAGRARYAENRRIHIGTNVTSYKGV